MSNMQGFVSIRLLAISWPPIVLHMFDFTRFFSFNFDIIRPECTVDYTPQTKLVFVLIGPIASALFIIMLVAIVVAVISASTDRAPATIHRADPGNRMH